VLREGYSLFLFFYEKDSFLVWGEGNTLIIKWLIFCLLVIMLMVIVLLVT